MREADLSLPRRGDLEANQELGLRFGEQTSDALFSVVQIPSNGWSGSQLENVRKMLNSGIELGVWADLLRNDRLTWTLGVTYATNEGVVLDLGGSPSA